MTTDRPYRLRLSKDDAINEMKRVSGKQLDPYITSTFVELCQENKV